MTTPSSALSQGSRDTFDTGPLSWVMGEIRESLNRSKAALLDANGQASEEQSTTLRLAKSYLHQANGALQIVDVDGVAIITETVEELLDRVDAGQLKFSAELAGTVVAAYQALIEYLEELLAGMPHQPVRLFPYYRSLLEARGADRIHPSDLFFPNLAIRPQLPGAASVRTLSSEDYTSLRKRFERMLLPFLKSTNEAAELASAAQMRDIVAEIEAAQQNSQNRSFWWVMGGFTEAVAEGHIRNELYVKQLFGRINLQIRRLAQGSSSITERLLRDALFFIAGIVNPSPRAQQIRAAYQLDGLVPADYETRRYGQIDMDALAVARERLAQAKNVWNRIAGGDASAADAFEHEMRMLADAGMKLNSPTLSKLLRELKGIARHAAHAGSGDILGLEMATCLLFVEHALANINRLPDNFPDRANALTARLLAVVSGEQSIDSPQWMDDMSREAQQRQTMEAVGAEMQSSLRQVEKMLDEFFRDPLQHDALGQIDRVLHQIQGALAVLDQEDAVRTLEHTREVVKSFGDPGEARDEEQFRKVAQNVGALSFFIESLQLHADSAKDRFVFDAERGLFQAKLVEKKPLPGSAHNEIEPEAAAPGIIGPDPATSSAQNPQTVEDELALHQRQTIEIAMSLSLEPDNSALQQQLKESLEQIRLDATLIDNPEAGDRAKAGIELLARPDFSSHQEALASLITGAMPAQPAAESLPSVVAPESDEAIDAELLEIFLSEAEEVLATVAQTLPQSRSAPHSQEHLTTLRRSFHTLKGSGRMVGLFAFGEAAWSIEQVLNLCLSESRGGDPDLYALLEKAAELLGDWVQDLRTSGRSDQTPDALVAAAERVKAGEAFSYQDQKRSLDAGASVGAVTDGEAALDVHAVPFVEPASETKPSIVAESGSDAVTEIEALQQAAQPKLETSNDDGLQLTAVLPQSSESLDTDAEIEFQPGDNEQGDGSTLVETTNSLLPSPELGMGTNEAIANESELPPLPEVEEIVLSHMESQWFEPQPEVSPAEIAPIVQLPVALQPASQPPVPQEHLVAIADVIEFPPLQASEPKINDNVKRIGDLEISLPLHNIYLAETDELVRVLAQDIGEWRHEPERQVSVQSVHAAHSLAGSSATVGFTPVHELAHALEMVLQFVMRRPCRLAAHEFDTLEQTVERLKLMLQKFALGEMPVYRSEYGRLLHSMQRDIEARLDAVVQPLPALPVDESMETPGLSDESLLLQPEVKANQVTMVPDAAGQDGHPVHSLHLEDNVSSTGPGFARESDTVADALSMPKDELDADLLPVFLEEGRDILPQMGHLLRAWQEQPGSGAMAQPLLRNLHTLKGSARMAGAMELGQHLHDMEARIESLMRLGSPSTISLEDLLVRYDLALQLFEQLQNPDAPKPATIAPAIEAAPVTEPEEHHPVVLSPLIPLQSGRSVPTQTPVLQPTVQPTAAPIATAPLVRVRADILDRLVNQAGEVSISRSKLETEVGTLRQSLGELTENVVRLRDQLRELEMQAETQIASQMAQSADREFDPLEFDRFTRLQELTRMMAESVNDIGSVHQNLSRAVEWAANDLNLQARLTRDLQQDLMRVRMVQFASISERLFRVTRQAAKEVDKRVNLDIRGGAVEIDRSVLERMTGPFEHLLRNAIVHGIESRAMRRAAGKNEVGELLVEIRQEGNEVVIRFSDDGRGLDVNRIRDKARIAGLLANDDSMSDEEVTDLIFHPGFSTVDEVTELAGRGVGMDVVRSEAAALGGRVLTWSEPGKGAHFTIHLPLTLAVTQVVLVSTGGATYAVPSVLVEQVQQLKANPLAAAYNDGAVIWQGQRVPMYYLPALLGDTSVSPVTQQYSPLIILKSGGERVALHVDEVIGNREVVVKNIGLQLSRMAGVAGATVLGSGDIVLILNPVPLAQRAVQENVRAPRIIQANAADNMGAVAEMTVPATPKVEPVQGLRTHNIVMVVDDSLTVRRVTQRLLAREGYQVVLAKDGVDALEHLQSITPDVMLVDIEMPRMDGFDLTRNVRNDERTRHIPIIMITSRTASKHRSYALELGVNEYLGKPYQEEQLLSLIAGYVTRETPAR